MLSKPVKSASVNPAPIKEFPFTLKIDACFLANIAMLNGIKTTRVAISSIPSSNKDETTHVLFLSKDVGLGTKPTLVYAAKIGADKFKDAEWEKLFLLAGKYTFTLTEDMWVIHAIKTVNGKYRIAQHVQRVSAGTTYTSKGYTSSPAVTVEKVIIPSEIAEAHAPVQALPVQSKPVQSKPVQSSPLRLRLSRPVHAPFVNAPPAPVQPPTADYFLEEGIRRVAQELAPRMNEYEAKKKAEIDKKCEEDLRQRTMHNKQLALNDLRVGLARNKVKIHKMFVREAKLGLKRTREEESPEEQVARAVKKTADPNIQKRAEEILDAYLARMTGN
jgi:hypothetical protein